MLRQPLQCFTVTVQCRLKILFVFLRFLVVNLSCVLFLLALLKLSLCLLNLLSNIRQEQVLIETMNISKFHRWLLSHRMLMLRFLSTYCLLLNRLRRIEIRLTITHEQFGLLVTCNVLEKRFVVLFDPLGFLLQVKLLHLHGVVFFIEAGQLLLELCKLQLQRGNVIAGVNVVLAWLDCSLKLVGVGVLKTEVLGARC